MAEAGLYILYYVRVVEVRLIYAYIQCNVSYAYIQCNVSYVVISIFGNVFDRELILSG
jgi:hypothetical protein